MSDQQPIVTLVVSPTEVTPTFIHCDELHCSNAIDKRDTFEFLDKKLDQVKEVGMSDALNPIILVLDPADGRKLVYDGNKRVRHAMMNGYQLRAELVTSQQGLDYLFTRHSDRWFDIRTLGRLLEIMRIYAQYPHCNQPMPPEARNVVHPVVEAYRRYQETITFGGPDDDE